MWQLELDNKRLQREKDVMEKNMMKYEDQLATKEQEIRELRKRCASVPQHAHVPGPAKNNEVNQELSEYLRDAHVTQLSSDKDLLEYQLHEARTEYKTMLSQNLSKKLLMEEKIKSLEKQIQNMLREKEELLAMVKTLTAEKKASDEFFWKQVQNEQEQCEQMLKSVQDEVTHPLQSHDQECHELQTVRSQLEDSNAKVTAPEQAKQVVQNDLDEEKKEREVLVALNQKLEKENKDEEQCQQQLRQEVETLKQQLTAAQQEAAHSSQHVTELTEERKRTAEEYKIKQADMQQQMKRLWQQLSTAREEAVCSSQQVTELTKEKSMIKEVYENQMAELREQLVTQQCEMKQQEESAMFTGTVEGLGEEKERGRGCYGAVYEVRVDGVPCIAKRLHDILVGRKGMEPVGDEQRTAAIKCFRRECALLSGLRHPNVVQFMGVHCGSDEADISLIMEYMHMDLGDCIKRYPNIPLPYKTSILRDVAYGLAYLHSHNIIHRDLNAGNVLLTESLRAKIADLGMSKLFDRKVVMQRTKTVCPGALDFMPPESLTKAPKYSDKLDIFSFGHLTVNLVNQEEPHVDDSSIVSEDVEKKQIQFGKRREALDQMGHQLGGSCHLLYSTVVQCLSDTPDQRPTSRDLVKKMEEICQQHSIPHKNTLETLTVVATLRSSSKEQEEVLKEMKQYNTQLKSSNQVWMLV